MAGVTGPTAPTDPIVISDDPPYPSGMTIVAVLAAIFVPFVSLVVALVMRGTERGWRRRQFLKNWAIGSAVWMVTGWLIPIIALATLSSGVSGCKGGIDQLTPPSFTSNDGVHWTETYTCMNGGTGTRPAPPGSVPGQ